MRNVLFLLPFFLLTQNTELASGTLFAQKFGAARGPVGRVAVPPKTDIQVTTSPATVSQTARNQNQPKIASQWNQTNQAAPARNPGGSATAASIWNPAVDPHPAVVRIIAFDKGNRTHVFGSGTCISSSGLCGIVITNWHVVRDSAGLVQVHFPNGAASYAAIISHDETWDLTILMISKPENVPIVPIAKTAPKIGEPLWIAGYGSGQYRLVGGHCTQYITPEIGLRNEFVELSVEARQGDSGGPIFNQKGELAGVLFGSDNYNTAGSFCGRVQLFLEQSKERIKSVPPEPEKLFESVEPGGAPQHTLNEGAELFRYQVEHSNKSTRGVGTQTQSYTYSDPRNGRGSASAREIKPPGTSPQISYPNFPEFTKQVPRQETAGQNGLAVPAEIHYNTTVSRPLQRTLQNTAQNTSASLQGTVRSSPAGPSFSQPGERIAMAVSPPETSPLFVENADSDIDAVVLSDSALVAASQSGSFFTTLKIIAAIVVVFFIIFHLVKLMSIIEENY